MVKKPRRKKLRERARQGSGCVYRPKYKDGSGVIREGQWRIKFTYTDRHTGLKKTLNELVPNATSATAAQDYLKQRMLEKASGKPEQTPATLRYEELREAVIADYELNNRKSLYVGADGTKTIGNLRHLDAKFSGREATSITTSDVDELKIELRRKGFANATINLTLAVLRRMFSLAVSSGRLHDDQTPSFTKLKLANAREGFVELSDFLRLREELPEAVRAFVTLLFYTGMRFGETRKLTWDNVDLKNAKLRLEGRMTKNGKTRTIPLMGELPEMLKIERERFPGAKHVFSRDGRSPIRTIRKAWIGACSRAGLGQKAWACKKRGCTNFNRIVAEHIPKDKAKHVCSTCGSAAKLKYFGLLIHDLRRTGVRNLVRAGVPDSVAMAISGHKTRAVFERYNVTSERDLDDAARKLERYMDELSKPAAGECDENARQAVRRRQMLN
jgi:integrase